MDLLNLKKEKISFWFETTIREGHINYFESNEFTCLEKIDEGGFDVVYKSEWEDLGKEAVLKCLKSAENLDGIALKTFIKELKILQQTSFHSNIIRFYGITKEPSSRDYYMVLQYANNGNLHEYLEHNFSSLECVDKLRMAREITAGLEFLHMNNLIHKNLNAKKILIHEGQIKISAYSPLNSTDNNYEKYRVLPYVAPEVLHTKTHTCEADIYSFSILFYEIMFGISPYGNIPYDIDLENRICNGLRPEIPKQAQKTFTQLMIQCWDVEPSQRLAAVKLKNIFERKGINNRSQ
ncbi:kinase-like domain-containing protein [Gigaspora rosea]|uniref:Kinase-like domain-containing protein n=1 Tax=Gigaspora rosea TaxID=44941 RepID=A0A397UD43_9GLOM|nr:kinase-like domain-containing protein [Gigaspora rosea]